MINTILLEKLMRLNDYSEERIADHMADITDTVYSIFSKRFIIYLDSKFQNDDKILEFAKIAEEPDGEETMKKYLAWVQENPEINFDEFYSAFEKEIHNIEVDIIKSLSQNLTDEERKEALELAQAQEVAIEKYSESALESFEKLLSELENNKINPKNQIKN